MKRYEARYRCIFNWFQKHPRALFVLTVLYRWIPYITAVLYILLILKCICILKDSLILLKVIGIPLFGFLTVSVFRRCINAPRPYTKYNITPLIVKEKPGESFPSRHMLSITMIAMAWLYADWRIGIFLWTLSFPLAATRILAGVHFVRDVIGAAVISIIFGYIGFWLL